MEQSSKGTASVPTRKLKISIHKEIKSLSWGTVGRENRSKPKASPETVPNIKITQTCRLGLVSLLCRSLGLLDANAGLLLNMSSRLGVKVEEMPVYSFSVSPYTLVVHQVSHPWQRLLMQAGALRTMASRAPRAHCHGLFGLWLSRSVHSCH